MNFQDIPGAIWFYPICRSMYKNVPFNVPPSCSGYHYGMMKNEKNITIENKACFRSRWKFYLLWFNFQFEFKAPIKLRGN